ncbi:hypothetical protein [Pseudonocardia sp. WMMC193]|uniref:hypothetical protein n=1 Tax=Pseudonocardia sp. WMMC193 TaxID=2911965 RepID=UPI001F450486|nr:hypothetical protein [Pseudonocardia sp. WMMC193]MCF7552595.1 hypothetical protein [Pseudonocardia sp. WMMC193]
MDLAARGARAAFVAADDPGLELTGVLMQFRVSVKNQLPDALLELARKHGEPDEITEVEEEANAAQRELDLSGTFVCPVSPSRETTFSLTRITGS